MSTAPARPPAVEGAIVLEALPDAPIERRRVELVERKGIGHPDTICDCLVEAISVALNAMYLERVGAVPHYNIDKALLIAGQAAKGFGWGELTRPMELIVGDRATFVVGGLALPVEETARAAVDTWVARHLPHVNPSADLVMRSALAPGSAELTRIFRAPEAVIVSNDTCGASGYAPLSPTERLVADVERFLNSAAFKTPFPDTGEDVKVFARRRDDRVTVTVAMPLLAHPTTSEARYFARKDEVLAVLQARYQDGPFAIEWHLNTLDRPGASTEGVYLTVSGTSAEDGDSGQVGRGNRANGLIAFSRPTGGEAAAGKNPIAHAGKVYSVLSHRLAALIHARCPALAEVQVHLSVSIGAPVDRPAVGVQVILGRGMALGDVEGAIREVVAIELERMPAFRAELIRGEHSVC